MMAGFLVGDRSAPWAPVCSSHRLIGFLLRRWACGRRAPAVSLLALALDDGLVAPAIGEDAVALEAVGEALVAWLDPGAHEAAQLVLAGRRDDGEAGGLQSEKAQNKNLPSALYLSRVGAAHN